MEKSTIMLACLLLFASCGWRNNGNKNSNTKQQDEFYTVYGGWDWIRVPLIKPYEVIKVDPEMKQNSWIIQFQSSKLYNTYNVKRIAVEDSVLYVLCGTIDNNIDTTIIGTRNVRTAWFLIDVRKKIEEGFDNEAEFKGYLSAHYYVYPQWHDIDSLFKALCSRAKLPWLPTN